MIVYVTLLSKLNGTKITAISALLRSYIEFYLCYAYVVNPVSLTPMASSRLRDLRSVRHPSLVAYPWLKAHAFPPPAALAPPLNLRTQP
jgi:hypothetical protein